MKITLIILFSIGLIGICLLVALSIHSRSGKAVGLVRGQLSPCPNNPNCVSSEAGNSDLHHVEPLILPTEKSFSSSQNLQRIIQEMGGKLQSRNDDYVAATFSTKLFGFVDDLEVRIDRSRGIAHVRSASRVGYSDGGINRQRVDRLAEIFKAQFPEEK